jgi:hypothetical protein
MTGMLRTYATILVLAGLLAAGCSVSGQGGGREDVPATQPIATMPGVRPNRDAAGDPNRLGAYMMIVRLKLVTIEVPVGQASGSEEIWSYLDEEPVRTSHPSMLGRNGLRAGVGKRSSWPDLAKVITKLTGSVPRQNMAVALPGNPLPIVLRDRQGEQSIFVFHEDRTLSGSDYPPGDNVLAVACTLDQDDRGRVFVSAVPQIRSTHRRSQYVLSEAGATVSVQPDCFPFASLTFQASLTSGDFIILGPGAQSRRTTSVGHRFLVREKEGVEFETLIVMAPEAVAAPLPGRAAAIGQP